MAPPHKHETFPSIAVQKNKLPLGTMQVVPTNRGPPVRANMQIVINLLMRFRLMVRTRCDCYTPHRPYPYHALCTDSPERS